MPEVQVKKVVAVCFLEAAKLSLEHLAAFRLELSQMGVPGPADLPRLYGEVRRLRDYLQRCASGYQETVVLDLAPGDASLLVACCRRGVEMIEHQLTERAVSPEEREWLQKKRTVLSDWAVEIAVKPLLELPLHRLGATPGEATRALTTRLQAKVYGSVGQRSKIVAPGTGPVGIDTGQKIAYGGPITEPEPVTAPPPRLDGFSFESDESSAASSTSLLDPKQLRDPRLRSLANLDLTSYERCAAAGDHRLAAVLLASILESAVFDHAIPRRTELGLTGAPDTWVPHDVLLRALGEAIPPKDRALAYQLFAVRNVLRPAQQMVSPAAVTSDVCERMRDLVARCLHALGFGGQTASPAQDLVPEPTFDD